MSGFDKFNNLRKRDIAAEKGIEAKWDSRFIPVIALSEPGSLGSQPANNVFIRRRGVDIARDFAVDAVKTGELKEVRLLQMDRIFVSILGRTCLWRTVSDSISGAENCTVTRRSSAHWPVMSEGSKHVCSINCCIRSWLDIFPPV